MMSQSVYISSNTSSTPKIRGRSLRNDWNEYQHLATQGRFIEPKLFSGFHNQRIRLTTVKKQLYNPRLPTIRRIERDEVLCRLTDEHVRHTTTFTEEQFQNLDPKRDESFIEFTGLNWHNTGRTLMGVNDSSFIQGDSSFEFGARLRPDKSQRDAHSSQTKLYQSASLFAKSPSATLPKLIQNTNYHNHGNNTLEQNLRTRFRPNHNHSSNPAEGIFRSSSMYVAKSARSQSPIGHYEELKSSRV